jgi:hypothetical protein
MEERYLKEGAIMIYSYDTQEQESTKMGKNKE